MTVPSNSDAFGEGHEMIQYARFYVDMRVPCTVTIEVIAADERQARRLAHDYIRGADSGESVSDLVFDGRGRIQNVRNMDQ